MTPDAARESIPADAVELVDAPAMAADAPEGEVAEETVSEPAKVMRIGSMIKQLLEEVRQAPLDEKSRARLRNVFDRSVTELSSALSPDLQDELHSLALPFADGEIPSESELRIAQAQLVGWLEGLFHGIQATLFAQQMAAQAQLQQMRGGEQQRGLPPGMMQQEAAPSDGRPVGGGTYL
jgi:Protein of unknown function (DUF2587)